MRFAVVIKEQGDTPNLPFSSSLSLPIIGSDCQRSATSTALAILIACGMLLDATVVATMWGTVLVALITMQLNFYS